MNIELSNELLSAVLSKKVIYLKENTSLDPQRNSIVYNTVNKRDKSIHTISAISIYELQHECKKWALSKSYVIASFIGNDNLCHASINIFEQYIEFHADSEPEAVILACQWILDTIKEETNV